MIHDITKNEIDADLLKSQIEALKNALICERLGSLEYYECEDCQDTMSPEIWPDYCKDCEIFKEALVTLKIDYPEAFGVEGGSNETA